jgi:hypothetical protein
MERERLPELKLADGDLFGAALVAPGFTSDLSTWIVTIHKHGLLTQTVCIAQPPTFDGRIAVLRQHVSRSRLDELKAIVEEERLFEYGTFPDMCITDQELTQIIIRLNGTTKIIDAYGPHAVSSLGESETDKATSRRYCRLWDAIEVLTPFKPYRD